MLLAPLLTAGLAACATGVTVPALPESHPAHPAAAAAEPIRPSGLLDRAAAAPAVEPAVTRGHDHQGHAMSGSAPPAPPPDSATGAAHEDVPGAHQGHEQPPREHQIDEHPAHQHEAEQHEADEPVADEHDTHGDPVPEVPEEHEHHHDPDPPPPGAAA